MKDLCFLLFLTVLFSCKKEAPKEKIESGAVWFTINENKCANPFQIGADTVETQNSLRETLTNGGYKVVLILSECCNGSTSCGSCNCPKPQGYRHHFLLYFNDIRAADTVRFKRRF